MSRTDSLLRGWGGCQGLTLYSEDGGGCQGLTLYSEDGGGCQGPFTQRMGVDVKD